MRRRVSRFVGKLAGVLGSRNFIINLKKERQEETEEERGTLIPRGKKWVLLESPVFIGPCPRINYW